MWPSAYLLTFTRSSPEERHPEGIDLVPPVVRSIRDILVSCGDREHWSTWTTGRRCRGMDERWECPTTMHPYRVGGSVSKTLAGTTVDEVRSADRKVEDEESIIAKY